jgi:hypothetical protein
VEAFPRAAEKNHEHCNQGGRCFGKDSNQSPSGMKSSWYLLDQSALRDLDRENPVLSLFPGFDIGDEVEWNKFMQICCSHMHSHLVMTVCPVHEEAACLVFRFSTASFFI